MSGPVDSERLALADRLEALSTFCTPAQIEMYNDLRAAATALREAETAGRPPTDEQVAEMIEVIREVQALGVRAHEALIAERDEALEALAELRERFGLPLVW